MSTFEDIFRRILYEFLMKEQNASAAISAYEGPNVVYLRDFMRKEISKVEGPDNKVEKSVDIEYDIEGNIPEVVEAKSLGRYKSLVISTSKRLSRFKPGLIIEVSYPDQKNYSYKLKKRMGEWKSEYPNFQPDLTPAEILKAGVGEGWLLRDCFIEFPREWYLEAIEAKKIAPVKPNKIFNKYRVLPVEEIANWKESEENRANLLLEQHDPRGFIQWYFRFYIGRRIPMVDRIRINRWIQFKRKFTKYLSSCRPGDLNCRPRVKQALLLWALDPEKYCGKGEPVESYGEDIQDEEVEE